MGVERRVPIEMKLQIEYMRSLYSINEVFVNGRAISGVSLPSCSYCDRRRQLRRMVVTF